MTEITQEDLRRSLPANLRGSATQELADKINSIAADPIMAKEIGDNFISYASVLKEGKFKIDDYINAVTYVTRILMGDNNQEAYASTFPERMIDMTANGYSAQKISSYVAAYNKGKLVNLIREQTLIPMWVQNAHIYQKAINVQSDLMMGATSELVRTQAANSILTHLQKPKEAANLQLNINTGSENSSMNALAEALNNLSEGQRKVIQTKGMSAKEVAHSELIEGDYEEIQD